MSVSLLLIPAVIAAVSAPAGTAAIGAASLWGAQHARTLQVETRMRDAGLLTHALGDLGAELDAVQNDMITARIGDVDLDLRRDATGIWQAHLDGVGRAVELDEAQSLMSALDQAYAARVQRAVVERIRERAPGAGMSLVSETVDDDAGVTLVLEVNRSDRP